MPVHNLTIRGLHTFVVGESQLLVHNTSGSEGSDIPLANVQDVNNIGLAQTNGLGKIEKKVVERTLELAKGTERVSGEAGFPVDRGFFSEALGEAAPGKNFQVVPLSSEGSGALEIWRELGRD